MAVRYALIVFLSASSLASGAHSLSLKGIRSGAFTVSAGFGTPVQHFALLVSVGQNMTWIPSSGCLNCQQLRVKPYNQSASATFQHVQANTAWTDQMTYLIDNDAAVQAAPSEDSLRLFDDSDNRGIIRGDPVFTDGAMFGQATQASDIDFTEGYDGILGLGLSDQSIVNSLYDAGKISSKVVGIALHGDSQQPSNASGTLTFGGVDTSLFHAGSMCYYPVLPASSMRDLQATWTMPFETVELNGHLVDAQQSLSLNSASLWSYASEASIASMAKQIGAVDFQGTYLVNTSTKFNLTFTVETQDCNASARQGHEAAPFKRYITLNEKDLVLISPANPTQGFLLLAPYERALQASSRNGANASSLVSGWTLGIPFMKKLYVVLDYGTSPTSSPRIGLADKRELIGQDSPKLIEQSAHLAEVPLSGLPLVV